MLDISRKAYYPKTTMTNGFALKSEFKKPNKTARRVFALINPELLQNCYILRLSQELEELVMEGLEVLQ